MVQVPLVQSPAVVPSQIGVPAGIVMPLKTPLAMLSVVRVPLPLVQKS